MTANDNLADIRLERHCLATRGKRIMFERIFQRAVGVAARLLFAASLVMVVWGVVYAIYVLSNVGMSGPSLSDQVGWVGASMSILNLSFAPAAQLFFGSVIVHYLELWIAQRARS